MTVIADITVPSDAFVLGRILSDFPDIEAELERIVPLRESPLPLLRLSDGDPDAIESTFRDHPQIERVETLTSDDGQMHFELDWSDDIDGMVETLVDTRARILDATGTAGTWDFRLRFGTHESLSSFNMAVTEMDVPVTLRHLSNPGHVRPPTLSPEQREALELAYRAGYFEVPRRTKLTALAKEMNLSDSAVSQRIRRGVGTLIEQSLLPDDRSRP